MKLSALVDLLIITGVSTYCDWNDGVRWSYYEGHCYYVSGYKNLRNNSAALLRCQELDSYLLSITSWEESSFVVENVLNCQQCDLRLDRFWIGLRKNFTPPVERLTLGERRANWTWQSGEPYIWHNWYHGSRRSAPEPSTDFGYGLLLSGLWFDWEPASKFRFICEKPDRAVMTAPETTYKYTDQTTGKVHSASITSWHDGSVGVTSTTHLQATTETSKSDAGNASFSAGNSDTYKYIYIGVALGAVVVAVIAVVIFVFLWRQRSPTRRPNDEMYYNTRQGADQDATANTTHREGGTYAGFSNAQVQDEHQYSQLNVVRSNSTVGEDEYERVE